ncbi:MAG: pentapeptide repeat-containing protein [Desulfuromonadaceae bacterium]|nr:pentapeptide repeat-containing protein [Desulfuromonadaceae bacterium]MDD2848849.1 pentapeptide repeat-containing protein [Desulfuromonadaceae bacterium]MDD4132194.1 pentapeptide repeat-containing protein [Desulfuromonadaceae bacterium]
MTMKLRVLNKTCLILTIVGAFSIPSPSLAQERYANSDLGAAATNPDALATNGPDTKKSTVYEPKPGEKLSYKQIAEILSTTRNLAGRNLSGLNLVGLDLRDCNLQGADMRGSNLERANMMGSNLERVDMTGANLKMTSFYQSALTAAKLDQATLDGAIWINKGVCAKGSVGECIIIGTKPEQPTQGHGPTNPTDKAGGGKP